MLKADDILDGGAMMKRLAAVLMLLAPLALTFGYAVLPSICLVLFFIFPPLVLLCIGPFAGLLPTDFQTFL
jgi:fatty acid desaturase